MESNGTEVEELQPVKLDTEVKNSIRHTFEALQDSNGKPALEGEVAKSKLQLLCATISRDVGTRYSAEDLDKYKEEKKSLSCMEFVGYLEEHLLPKGGTVDAQKHHQLFWTIVRQAFYKKEDHILSEDLVYKQWLIFNTLDIDETSRVHKEELGLLLEKISHAIGKVWNPNQLNNCVEGEDLTFWQYLECLEKHCLAGSTKSIYQEALEEIVDFVVNDVLIQGYIIKKGHMVKSTKNRWFVLKPGVLSYYTNRTRADKKGEIAINKETKVAATPDSKKYRFSITCGRSKTNYDLEARDQRTKQEWLVALQKAIENSDGQSVQRKERLQRRLDRNENRLAKLVEERRKQEQANLVLAQQEELESLRQKYSDAEAQALLEAENLQEEIRRREELEKLHQELQQLLLAEKEAREAEAIARALQEELLMNEKKRMEEMERMKIENDKLLQEELKMRESLEERQVLQEKLLEEERQRFEILEKERQAAEQAMKEAKEKLEAAQAVSRSAAEEAKRKAREIKTCTGLARPIGPQTVAFVTHRGVGAFCEDDFERIRKKQKIPPSVLPKPKRPNGETPSDKGENDADVDADVERESSGENITGDDDAPVDADGEKEISTNDKGERDRENHGGEDTTENDDAPVDADVDGEEKLSTNDKGERDRESLGEDTTRNDDAPVDADVDGEEKLSTNDKGERDRESLGEDTTQNDDAPVDADVDEEEKLSTNDKGERDRESLGEDTTRNDDAPVDVDGEEEISRNSEQEEKSSKNDDAQKQMSSDEHDNEREESSKCNDEISGIISNDDESIFEGKEECEESSANHLAQDTAKQDVNNGACADGNLDNTSPTNDQVIHSDKAPADCSTQPEKPLNCDRKDAESSSADVDS